MNEIQILDNFGNAYLPGVKAAVTIGNSRDMFAVPDVRPTPITLNEKSYRGIVPWGTSNNLPQLLITKLYANPVMSSGLDFNIKLAYGEGITPGHYIIGSDGKRKFQPDYTNAEVNKFFEENDIQGYLLEQLTDLSIFYNIFPEIILNSETTPKIVSLKSKEASFSRWEAMNPATGEIENHFYSANFGITGMPAELDIDVTPVLSRNNTLRDLKVRMGLERNSAGKFEKPSNYRFIVPVSFATPGRFYYQKPYYYSIIESGWYDLAAAIPEFKNAMMKNQMTLRFHVELSEDYFTKIFATEDIRTDEAKKARIKKEYSDINSFLSGLDNAGKSVISFVRYTPDGKEMHRIKITVLDTKAVGGEYLEDSEEASNVMSFGMGVHPSLIGSAPGKNSAISGSNSRELFIIKQALQRPIRDRVLRPLYIIKNFNGWDPTLDFEIPNMELTTLDQGTGSQKVIS